MRPKGIDERGDEGGWEWISGGRVNNNNEFECKKKLGPQTDGSPLSGWLVGSPVCV